jgi:membrane fusion protein (multidrug efflux system)
MAGEKKKNNHRGKGVALTIVVLMVCAATAYYFWSRGRITTDDAYVDGHIYRITPRISGYVTKVYVQDNQSVKEGEPLLSLDPTDYEVALAEAKASLAEAEATLTSLELGVPLEVVQTGQRVRAARAQLESLRKTMDRAVKEEEAAAQDLRRAEALHELSLNDLRRIRELAKSKVAAQSQLDQAETSYQTTRAQVGAAKAKLESAKKQKASLESDMEALRANVALASTGQDSARIKARQVEAQRARVELAGTRVKQAQLDLSYTTIPSPADGYVTRKGVEPGLAVSKGQPLMAVVPLSPENLWVTANFKETQLTHVRPGQDVILRIDTYPDLEIKGKVDSVMAGTGSVFSLFPPENATGNFVKIVQRIPVKIVLPAGNPHPLPPLRIGMSVIPTILIDR